MPSPFDLDDDRPVLHTYRPPAHPTGPGFVSRTLSIWVGVTLGITTSMILTGLILRWVLLGVLRGLGAGH